MIVLFRGMQLVEKLRRNQVSEFHKLLYLSLPIICGYLWELLLPSLSNKSALHFPAYVMLIKYTSAVSLIFYINYKGDNKDFLSRFICLSFPATVIINTLGALYGLFIIAQFTKVFGFEKAQAFTSAFFQLNGLLFYLLIGYWIFCVSKKVKEN